MILCDMRDHTLTMTMAITTTTTTAITTAMTMATTTTKKLHQYFSKMILCDFRVSLVSQINWQPIGKLLFMINLHASPDQDQVSKSGPFRSHCLGHFRAS